MNKLFILFVAAIFFLASCHSTRHIQTAIAKIDTVAAVIVPDDHGREDSIAFIKENYNYIQNNRISFTSFTAKIDINIENNEGKKDNLTAHIRMYKDSAIWITITGAFGIEGLRAFITRDSVRLLDKQNKTYTLRSVAYLQEVTSLPLDLLSLQDLLLGNPVFLDSNIISYNKSGNSISLMSSGDFFKNLFTIGETDKLIQSSKLDDQDETRNRTCYLRYDDYENKKGVGFSTKRNISVSEKKKLDIELDFKQYEFNEKLSFPFSVPRNYKRN